ncbi:hypothetical protein LMG27198_32440 [Methylocystis echinoides]|uniref:Uncharacterized protein n=1 Tax=Methylocystis echinoides TaxID=29468 RepID=A0A9W6LT81_9HYPH|nr:hypothetical protein LMG27198_32440 [Methylocystis echinoides]
MRWRHPPLGAARVQYDEGFQRLTACRVEKPKTFARGSAKNVSGADALLWGVETPLLPFGAGRYGTALLDLWSGSLWRIQQAFRAKGHGAV